MEPHTVERDPARLRELQTFVVELGAELNAAGEAVYTIQDRLATVAAAYGARNARITAFPTFLMVTMGLGDPVALELTSLLTVPRLDQLAALERLLQEAERGAVEPAEGLRRLEEIRDLHPRFGRIHGIVGYATLSLGLCLILHPAPRDVAAAAVFGALVGLLRTVGRTQAPFQVLLPVLAAFMVSALCALAVKHDLTDPGLRAMVASLVVFLPGATLTTSVLELAAGQMISGSARFVSGVMQLALLSFGILAGIEAVGASSSEVFSGSSDLLGDFAPWIGVLVFAAGVHVANSAPARSFPSMLLVLYAAWAGQVLGNALLGAYVSAFIGALVMTPVAHFVARFPSAMSAHALFLPGFWILVPGALGLIGFTELANDASAGAQDLVATAISIFAVAVGVLCGTLLLGGVRATSRVVGGVSRSIVGRKSSRVAGEGAVHPPRVTKRT